MKIRVTIPQKQRNWVAKNDRNRAVVMRDRTQYQRRPKHPARAWQA